jgi:hypothetical protein
MARPLLTKNAVTNAVAANTPIAFCMTGISCVEWPDQTGPATYGLVRCLDVRIATRHRPAPREKVDTRSGLTSGPKPLRWGNRETTRAFSL